MFSFRLIKISLLSLAVTTLFNACVDEDSAQVTDPSVAFAEARSYYDDETWELAVTRLGEFKSRFPYSKFSVLAELFIANSLFELAKYEEAAVDYKQFVKLHPRHEKVPFAMYRVGEAYWIDAPESIDRDQSLTETAIKEWHELISQFPESAYAKRAREKVGLGERRIAESQEFVVAFYCKQEIYHACAYRAINLLETYPNYKDIKRSTLAKASEALRAVAAAKAEDPTSDKNMFFKRFTQAQLLEKAAQFDKILATMGEASH